METPIHIMLNIHSDINADGYVHAQTTPAAWKDYLMQYVTNALHSQYGDRIDGQEYIVTYRWVGEGVPAVTTKEDEECELSQIESDVQGILQGLIYMAWQQYLEEHG